MRRWLRYPGAVRRFPLSFLLLGVLSLLAAGALALGVLESPTVTANVAVHNGAGETLHATRIAGVYTASYLPKVVISFVFTAPDKATEVARNSQGAVQRRRSVVGSTATSILQPIRVLTSLHNFTLQHDGSYVSTEPVAQLVPPSQRSAISGTYRTTVRLTGGYVVEVGLVIHAVEQGHRLSETIDYKLSSIGDWRS